MRGIVRFPIAATRTPSARAESSTTRRASGWPATARSRTSVNPTGRRSARPARTSTAWRVSIASAQPVCPSGQSGPVGSSGKCPSRPTPASGWSTTSSCTTRPYPTPVPIARTAKRSQRRAVPNHCSARVRDSTSLSTTTGTPSSASSEGPNGTDSHPRYRAERTSPSGATRPPSPTPTARTPGRRGPVRSASERTRSPTTATQVAGERSGSGASSSATTLARRVVSTA